MKKIIVIIAALALMTACSEKEGYDVHIKTVEKEADWAYLLNVQNNQLVPFDSAQWKDGYQFTGSVERPELVFFNLKGTNKREPLFLENTSITVTPAEGNPGSFNYEGSKLNDIFEQYNDSANYYSQENQRLYSEYQKARQDANKTREDSIRGLVEGLYDKEQAYSESFALENLDNLVGLYIVRRKLVYSMDYEKLKDVLGKVPEDNQNNAYYEYLEKHLAKLEKTRIGKEAPTFTMKDTAGNEVALKDFRGNYTLVDFWAAWCGPCRRANPHVVEIYEEYHPKGFQVLGVSFDQSREAWIKAIHEDNLPWTQVSDLKGWKNEAGQLYGVNSIPHTVLIDPEGKIVANRFSHEELREKLEEIYQ
ncbi:Thiol-disulfide oxidoreductase ResA [Salinivirga cyanobacteriivorans]|uniref:Thiol-disulfide oxidoreductase ResA n=1 Tax=Salinivirga cyanobacteriivorans TaxID=1307839 RepID=A0A0S2HVJ0_9BACT|nr:TlpA disulfide reductase family protein [Salinivirga cyanobacteriivorans]ALO14063.1 Thiol-disulfide oxidoreductase ResA [Salinivirga cyanobacteriivorans]